MIAGRGILGKPWQRWLAICVLAAAALAGLGGFCLRSPTITFLPPDKRAEWILFPAALHPRLHLIASMDAIFRREFALSDQPRSARLSLRAARNAQVRINGTPVETSNVTNWKDVSVADVEKFLRAGSNIIEAIVFNDTGPPLLWLVLDTDTIRLRSDETWQASFAGSSWRNAIPASRLRSPGPGNPVAGGEETFRAVAKVWPVWLLFAAIAVAIWKGVSWWGRRNPGELSRSHATALLAGLGALWLILLCNNASSLRADAGFDAGPHFDYIKYILERHALPLPNEGYEMFQPPLYYCISAGVLSLSGVSATDPSALTILRVLTMLFGIAHFIIVFLCLRLFFPGQIVAQLIGLMIAAFLPMQLYLSHYVTNETLAALLASATIYFTLRVLRTDNAPLSIYGWTGLFMGAAISTKVTGLLLVPAVLAALVFNLIQRRASFATGFRNVAVMVGICLVVCAWHYIRIWNRFGTPLVGNWDIASGFAWWQDPGFHLPIDYFRFGRSLVHPLFSGFYGFFDGLYSTLWGDALCAGTAEMPFRTPWNYSLVAAGYLLALVPTILLLIGAFLALRRFVHAPSAEAILLLGFSVTVFLGVIFMTAKIASYAQIKAFYGLSLLVPICFFIAVGWAALARRGIGVSFILAIVLTLCAINSFASHWIHEPAFAHILTAFGLEQRHQVQDALSAAAKAVDVDPTNPTARKFLVLLLDKAGRTDEALAQIQHQVQLTPLDSGSHVKLGQLLLKKGDVDAAVTEARRANELGPENVETYNLLFDSLRRAQRVPESIVAAQDGLGVFPFDPELHFRLGQGQVLNKNLIFALNQFAYAAALRPDRSEPDTIGHKILLLLAKAPDAPQQLANVAATMPDSPKMLNQLAWLFATHTDQKLRNGAVAVELAQRASALMHGSEPRMLTTLAAGYAEIGKFPSAIGTTEEALKLARSSGDSDAVTLGEKLLATFRENRPYREEPIHE